MNSGMNSTPDRIGDLVCAYLTEQCTVIIDSEADLRAGENVVHTTRVAVRRLRSTIRVFADLFDETQAQQLDAELVWWAGMLGAVRDLDILSVRLAERLAELPPEVVMGPIQSTIQTELAVRRKKAADAMLAGLDSERYRKLVALVRRWRSDPPLTPVADESAEVIERYIKTAKKKVRKRLAHAVATRKAGEPSAELFHRARKSAKRHRYSVEAASPLWGSKVEQIVEDRKRLQDILGDHQDSIVCAAFLRELGARRGIRSGQNGFTFGVLYATETAAGDSLLTDLKPFL
jgi:CHAD domain-containing protein